MGELVLQVVLEIVFNGAWELLKWWSTGPKSPMGA